LIAAKLIRVVAHLKPADVAKVGLAYSKAFGRDLSDDIKKETSGNFEDALVGTDVHQFASLGPAAFCQRANGVMCFSPQPC